MNSREMENIFDTKSNRLDNLEPESLQMIWDRLLIEDIAEGTRLVKLPNGKDSGVGKDGTWRLGRVIVVGPGDPNKELGISLDGTWVRRKRRKARVEMSVAPGDLILYEQHKEAEIFIRGKRYGIIYEEQAALAVLPPGTRYDGSGGLILGKPPAEKCSKCGGSGESDKERGKLCRWCQGSGEEPE